MRAPSKAERQLDGFLEMIAAERGAARNTSEAYRRDLADYIAHLSRSGAEPQTATLEHLRDYLGALQHRGMSAATQARRLSALRQFHKFLFVDRHRADDPAASLEGPRRVKSAPRVLSAAEIERLLAAARVGVEAESASPAERLRALRLLALLETLYATGLRVSELLSLPKLVARARDPFIAVKGKGGRERLSPLAPPPRKRSWSIERRWRRCDRRSPPRPICSRPRPRRDI